MSASGSTTDAAPAAAAAAAAVVAAPDFAHRYPFSKSNNSRIVLLDSTAHPNNSLHWQGLKHESSDRLIQNASELASCFRHDVDACSKTSAPQSELLLAKWSCICGYIEALSTHKDESRRFKAFPLPIDAIDRLVRDEFTCSSWIRDLDLSPENRSHRDAAKAISNAVWKKVISKPSVRDELHANSLYICLRGTIDNKSLDCFGAAIVTVAALQSSGHRESYLTLSEDHAYESHPKEEEDTKPSLGELSTCEIAIPGNTKAQQQKRGKEISEIFTFGAHTQSNLNPTTSWLYMAKNPVICKTVPMLLGAVMGNINCQIEKKGGKSISSRELYEIKRDLLWVLHDEGALDCFPFALSELGDCEENVSSSRGLEWVQSEELGEEILVNEKLFIDSIEISRTHYGDSQIYPYCYAGHYHKDAGRENVKEEHRLVEAMRLYCRAAQVASTYVYEVTDSLQLVKTMTKIAELIAEDILTSDDDAPCTNNKPKLSPRTWASRDNAIALGTWLFGFFDSCLVWEEKSGGEESEGKHFVEILNPSHRHGIVKLFSLLEHDIRNDILSRVYADKTDSSWLDEKKGSVLREAVTESKLQYFCSPESKRLKMTSPLSVALSKKKISIGELELTIPRPEGGRRRRKKVRVH